MNKRLFILAETVIYLTFITLDLLSISSNIVKYLGIILCFIYCISNSKKNLSICLGFTLIADMFLLIIDKYYEIGLIAFIIVQIGYIYIINKLDSKYFKSFLFVRIFVVCLFIVVELVTNNFSLLNMLVAMYFPNLLISALEACSTNNKILAIGLLLFVCCDICVGIHNIQAQNTIIMYLMWVFYLPSQVLISLS